MFQRRLILSGLALSGFMQVVKYELDPRSQPSKGLRFRHNDTDISFIDNCLLQYILTA